MAALKGAWELHKKISDQIEKGDGKYASKEDLGELVEELRSDNDKRANLGKSYGLNEADMALIDKQFEILHLPKSFTEILTDLTINADYVGLKVFMAGFGGDDFNLEELTKIVDRDGSTPSEISYIDDEFSSDSKLGLKSELTYGITVNHDLNRVTAIGSQTYRWTIRILTSLAPMQRHAPTMGRYMKAFTSISTITRSLGVTVLQSPKLMRSWASSVRCSRRIRNTRCG
jgi:hypothetical protein